jgi:hypothetical protein
MSARSFRSVFMVASCAGAALGCYLVSLRVASERAALENVETEIVLAQRDIRLLQTEIGTRGRLAQLERWNVKVLALSAPSADQFLEGGFALAKMVAPRDNKVDLDAPVVLAAAPADGPKPQLPGASVEQAAEAVSARQMLHVASIKRETRPVAEMAKATDSNQKSEKKAAKPAPEKAAAKTSDENPVAAKAPSTAKAKPKAATTERKSAAADPLAPLAAPAKPKKVAASAAPRKENGSKQ